MERHGAAWSSMERHGAARRKRSCYGGPGGDPSPLERAKNFDELLNLSRSNKERHAGLGVAAGRNNLGIIPTTQTMQRTHDKPPESISLQTHLADIARSGSFRSSNSGCSQVESTA